MGLSACASALHWTLAFGLLQQMTSGPTVTGLRCNYVSYNTGSSAFEWTSMWPLCLELLCDARAVDMYLDQKSYRSPARATGHGANWHAALGMLLAMDRCRIEDADGSAWSAQVWACEAAAAPSSMCRPERGDPRWDQKARACTSWR